MEEVESNSRQERGMEPGAIAETLPVCDAIENVLNDFNRQGGRHSEEQDDGSPLPTLALT